MKTYWEILLGVVLWLGGIAGAIALVWWLTVLWSFTPLVLIGILFIMLCAFGIWVDQ